jgi:hypothetical protein
MGEFSVRCSKCGIVNSKAADDVFSFMALERVAGWQIPDAIENQPILCPTCKAGTSNQP